MIIATWNVNSIKVRLELALEWLTSCQPDILCLQETKIQDEKFPESAFSEIGYQSLFFGQKTYNGVAVLSKKPVELLDKNFPGSPLPDQARFLAVRADSLVVLNAYVPNGGEVGSDKYETKLLWLQELRSYLDDRFSAEEKVLLCGDFNVAPEDRDVHDPEGTHGGILVSDQEREALSRLKEWGFEDAFRMHVEEEGQYSWWDYRAMAFRRRMGFRIDHIWISKALKADCKRSWIDKEPRRRERPSDHTPVCVELNLN